MDEDGRYRRPIACRTYDDPIELFDAHLYQKAACVLEMLRRDLGDELFWRAVGDYLRTHSGGSVETDDLRKAIERVSGRNMERFFEQWITSTGYPEMDISSSWSDERGELQVTIEQKQSGELTPEAFDVPLDFRFLTGDGEGESACRATQGSGEIIAICIGRWATILVWIEGNAEL